MDGSVLQTYLSDVLHVISQALLAPDIILLIVLIGYALFCIGSVIAERFSERRHFTVTMPKFLAALMEADEDEIPEVIKNSGLLKRQKKALLTVFDYRVLPGDALMALIKRLVDEEETRYDRITGRNNMAARVAPMLGLMGTLIPLGPGIQALGEANTEALSNSLLVAFDTTVAGLVAAAVCMVVGKIRSNWYGNYMSALDSAMATMLQKIEDMRAEGKIDTKEPSSYAFMFESDIKTAPDFAKGEAETPADDASASRPASAGRSASAASAAPVTLDAVLGTAKTPEVAESPAEAGAALSLQPEFAQTATSRAFDSTSASIAASESPVASAAAFEQPTFATPQPAEQPVRTWAEPEQMGWKSVQLPVEEAAAAPQPAEASGVASDLGNVAAAAVDPFASAQAPYAQGDGQPATSGSSFDSFVAASGATFEPVPMPSFLDSLASAAVSSGDAEGYAQSSQVPADSFGVAGAQSAQMSAQVQPRGQYAYQQAYQPAQAYGAQAYDAQAAAQAQEPAAAGAQVSSGWYQPRLRTDDAASSGTGQVAAFDPYAQR